MRRLVTWTVDNEFGHSEGFTLPQITKVRVINVPKQEFPTEP